MYTNVVGNPDNVEDAAKLYREASDQGSPRGQTNLGFLYEHGTGVELDYKEAARLYGAFSFLLFFLSGFFFFET